MNLYDLFMAPLEKLTLSAIRHKLMPRAYGNVLEIGAGTGANIRYYKMKAIDSYTIIDQSINKYAGMQISENTVMIEGDATEMPFPDNTFDTVVETLVLCSIEKEYLAMQEIERVLKPGGIFLHIDHGLPKKGGMRTLFNSVAPLWRGMTKSCRLDKDFADIIANSDLLSLESHTSSSGIFTWGVLQKEA